MLQYEIQAWANGHTRVAGMDEAGRGPLAGPVVAAAVVFERPFLERESNGLLRGLTDSKRLSAARRAYFYDLLVTCPGVGWAIGRAESEEVDTLNILRATHASMRRAIDALPSPVDHILVDGLPVPGLPCTSTAVVGGDGLSLSIAAASVLAKVTRDRIMEELDAVYPGYGFGRHKGYGTKEHVEALKSRGPVPCHRRSFRPVRQMELDLPE